MEITKVHPHSDLHLNKYRSHIINIHIALKNVQAINIYSFFCYTSGCAREGLLDKQIKK